MKIVPKLPESSRGRPSKYPWNEWCDGQVRVAVSGVDYEIPTRSFVSTLHGRARSLQSRYWVETRVGKDDEGRETVTFKFVKEFQDVDDEEGFHG